MIGRFLSPLRTEQVDDSHVRLLVALIWAGNTGTFTVPKGFVSDFASVPRLPVIFAAFGDVAHEAAVLHDWLYSTGAVSRAVADSTLMEAMTATGIPTWRRWPIYWAVRAFGQSHFSSKAG